MPFGGGTSVVGGLRAARAGFAGVVALDLTRLDRLVGVDADLPDGDVRRPACGGRTPRNCSPAHGFTLGHYPQSFQYATLGGFAATRSSGQASAGYGRFDQLVLGLRAATPAGTLDAGRAPQSAAGPDLRQLLLGSEGAFGVITELTLQVRPVPAARRYAGWAFPSFADGCRAVRALAQDGPVPTVLRLSDEAETATNAAVDSAMDSGRRRRRRGRYRGDGRRRAPSREAAAGRASARGTAGRRWARRRAGPGSPAATAAPYLRDALLDAGALVETLETATFWHRLPQTYAAVRDALVGTLTGLGTPPIVMCHVSHVYPAGASLYFTVVAAQADDPTAQWRTAKAAASDAIVATGATITHHHGVGTDHRAVVRRGDRPGRRRHAARGQGGGRPGRNPQPRDPAAMTERSEVIYRRRHGRTSRSEVRP